MSYTVLHLDNPEQSFVLGDHVVYVNPPGSDEEPSLGVVYAMGNAEWMEAHFGGTIIEEGVSITPLYDPGDDHVIILQHANSTYHSYVASGGVFTYDSDTWLADHTLDAIPAPETIFYERMLLVFSDGIGYTAETVASTRTNQLYVIVNTGGSNYLPIIIAHTSVTGDDVELPPQSINDLTDVNTVSDPPAVNDLLQYDGTNWVPVTILGFGIDSGGYEPGELESVTTVWKARAVHFGTDPGPGIPDQSAFGGPTLVDDDLVLHFQTGAKGIWKIHAGAWELVRELNVGEIGTCTWNGYTGGYALYNSVAFIANEDGSFDAMNQGYIDYAIVTVQATIAANKALSTTFVEHGATAGTARPSGWGRVVWIGTVEPDNWISTDEWIDTTP